GLEEREALAIMAALETRSEHPLAEAVVEVARTRGLDLPAAQEFEVVAGKGVRGRVHGVTYAVGRPEWIAEQRLEFPTTLRRALEEAEARGESAIALMNEQSALAVVALADRVRQSARHTSGALKAAGMEPVMIT